jgi:hypothetical protein
MKTLFRKPKNTRPTEWLVALTLLMSACDQTDDPGQRSVPPTITFSLLAGGEIVSQTPNEAAIAVVRNIPLSITYEVKLPNGFLSARIDDKLIETVVVTGQKSARISTAYTGMHTGVPIVFSVMDKEHITTVHTINPTYEVTLDPASITDGNWEKTAYERSNENRWIEKLFTAADGSILAVAGAGLKKSTDKGATWREVAIPWSESIETIVVHPSGDLFAASVDGMVAKSTDHGINWTLLKTNFASDVRFGGMTILPNGTLQLSVLGTEHLNNGPFNSIWTSQDGVTWSLKADLSYWYGLGSITTIDSGTLFVVCLGWDMFGLLRSKDAGNTWEQTGSPFTADGDGSQSSIIYNVLPARNGNIYVACGLGIFVSKDAGKYWEKLERGLPEGNYPTTNWVAEDANGNIYTAPRDYGVFKLIDDEWKSVGTELAALNVPSIISIDGDLYAAAQPSSVYKLR